MDLQVLQDLRVTPASLVQMAVLVDLVKEANRASLEKMVYPDQRVNVVFLGQWGPEDLRVPEVLQVGLVHKVPLVRRVRKAFLDLRDLLGRLGRWGRQVTWAILVLRVQLVIQGNKAREVRWENAVQKETEEWLVLQEFLETQG